MTCPYCEHPAKYRAMNNSKVALYACKCKTYVTCRDCPDCLRFLDNAEETQSLCVCPARGDCTCGKAVKADGAWTNRVCVGADGTALCKCVFVAVLLR
jgi:hypothetical protein